MGGAPCPDEASCAEARAMLDLFLDDECDCDTTARLAAHVAHCDHCSRLADAERHLRAILRSSCVEEAPMELRARVLSRLSAMRVTHTTVTRTVVIEDGAATVTSTTLRTTHLERR
ncbi:Predicted transmembrane transcriptional regulator (anti-sigma factor) [Actinomyces bovis]|uniref:Predicted transmembrane transcriptional regulator (Anti-sigma factor) n=1 Tax=Actinomyces bovis TaxID=1658 RepID=A0ABY1VMP2_9ACTO|nr:mycothiol system anti-sigma-R factor [Actinomyces bovis]SPT53374.1 Predicted transmembrane transcriptional regulator (anti-sigma factor) [Actinomyces bovis]VEG52764.1 Predicted transmembrane transcriptional regulator (anti-sigma factor) [Actinomyces israelii]